MKLDVLGDLQEFQRLGEMEGCQSILSKLQVQDSQIIEVELWVILTALHVNHVLAGVLIAMFDLKA